MNFTKYFILFAISLSTLVFSSCDDEGDPLTRCDLPYDVGPCDAVIEKYYYDNDLGTCRSFSWGGCDGVVPFETLELCQDACGGSVVDPCSLVPDGGNCFAYIPAYYFDATTQSCETFIWGGCDGVVPFETLELCQDACGGSVVDPCSLIPDGGNCFAYIPAYYFDATTQSCETFIWGGCDGVVPFETLELCQDACGGSVVDPCSLIPDGGNCFAYIPAYYFDATTQSCETFIWGGCDGVVPFETLELCQDACGGSVVDPCSLTPDGGNCFAYIPAYYFDATTQSCETFIWGGCDGVVPFETMELCQDACGG